MKYRTSFVTNSSSTSFIIAVKGGLENLKNIIEVENNIWKEFIINSIEQLFNSSDDNDTSEARIYFNDETEMLNCCKDYYDREEATKLIEKYKKLLDDGYVVYRKNVSYHNNILNNQMRNMCDGENIILISNDD
jgi:hypothetical protein